MKFLVLKFLIIFLYLITTSLSFSLEQPNIKNIIINKDPKSYKNITFKDINNNEINLDNFRNKLIILNFWATWCLPCREEMPSLDKLQINKKFNNLKIFPINVGSEKIKKINKFFTEYQIKNLETYFDEEVSLAKTFSLRGLPTTILLDKEGQEFARIIGSIDFNDKEFIDWLSKFD